MKKLIMLLIAFLALGTWTFAQAQPDRDDRVQKTDKDKDKDKDNDRTRHNSTNAADNIRITSGPTVTSMSGNTATLQWTTSGVAANDVKYGTDPNNLSQRAFDREGSVNHTVQLTGLQPGQTVYFEILRRNSSVRDTGSFQFTGNGTANVQMNPTSFPNIGTTNNTGVNAGAASGIGIGGMNLNLITSGPTVEPSGSGSVKIVWTTSVPGQSGVIYGPASAGGAGMQQTATGSSNTTNHSVTVSGLQSGQQYLFQVMTIQTGTQNQIRSNTTAFTAP